jgi:hypothetical protein
MTVEEQLLSGFVTIGILRPELRTFRLHREKGCDPLRQSRYGSYDPASLAPKWEKSASLRVPG